MNTQLFLLINGLAGRWVWLDWVMIFCAHYLVYVMVAGVLVHVFMGYKKWRDMAIVALGSAFVARFIVASGIRYFYHHARPDIAAISQLHLLLAKETQDSFPSGHTIFVFALATGVYIYNKKWGTWFILLACLVGFARVFVGVHWPSDVVAGAVLGVLIAVVCNWIFKKYKHSIGL